MKVLVISIALAGIAAAQPRPPVLDKVRLDARIGERVPLDLTFSDAAGRRIELRELFDGKRPVLLVMSYVRCRMLCSLVLRGATDAVRAMPLALGRDYRFVIASIDPHEEAASAAARLAELRAQVGADGVTYLLGAERPTAALADRLGFRYAWDARTEQYAHPAVLFVLTPDGTLSRTVQGVRFAPAELASALEAAARGELDTNAVATGVLDCFRFDPAARAHRELIESYLRIGAIALSVMMLSSIVGLFLWERRRARVP